MVEIFFASVFPPIINGIGSYTKYLVDSLHEIGCNCGVISFNPNTCEFPVTGQREVKCRYPVLYVIPSCYDYCPDLIFEGLNRLSRDENNFVLWIQHGASFWRTPSKFIYTLRALRKMKVKNIVVTHHTLNFQSSETRFGFKRWQYELLKTELPLVDASTVFTNGVYRAFIDAFPKCKERTVLLRHGVPLYPRINREDARKELLKWLENKDYLSHDWRKSVEDLGSRLFEEDTFVIGDVGFVDDRKLPCYIHFTTEFLRKRFPDKDIIGLYIGTLSYNGPGQISCLQRLRELHSSRDNFYFLEAYVPEQLFAKSLKALDIVHMWYEDCRQSGKLAHAIGIGATVVGRDIEGVGETLKMSGYPALSTYKDFLAEIERIMVNSEFEELIGGGARKYIDAYRWDKQASKHLKLAESLVSGGKLPSLDLMGE